MLVNCAKVLERRGRTQRAPRTRTSDACVAPDPKCCERSLLWKAVCFSGCKSTSSLRHRAWGQPHLTCRKETKGFRLTRGHLGSHSPKLQSGLGTTLWASSSVSWDKFFILKTSQTFPYPLIHSGRAATTQLVL